MDGQSGESTKEEDVACVGGGKSSKFIFHFIPHCKSSKSVPRRLCYEYYIQTPCGFIIRDRTFALSDTSPPQKKITIVGVCPLVMGKFRVTGLVFRLTVRVRGLFLLELGLVTVRG